MAKIKLTEEQIVMLQGIEENLFNGKKVLQITKKQFDMISESITEDAGPELTIFQDSRGFYLGTKMQNPDTGKSYPRSKNSGYYDEPKDVCKAFNAGYYDKDIDEAMNLNEFEQPKDLGSPLEACRVYSEQTEIPPSRKPSNKVTKNFKSAGKEIKTDKPINYESEDLMGHPIGGKGGDEYNPQSEKENEKTFKSFNENINEGLAVEILDFAQHVVEFLKNVLTDPSQAGLSPFWKQLGVSRGELFSAMADLGIITSVVVGGVRKYKVMRKNFKRNIKRLYNYLTKPEELDSWDNEPKNVMRNPKMEEADGAGQEIVGLDILDVYPFSELPDTRAEVDWDNRGVEGWGPVHLPNPDDTLSGILEKDAVITWLESFKKQFNEDPVFQLNPDGDWYDKVVVTNPAFLERKEKFMQAKGDTLDKWGTTETTTAASSGAFVGKMGLGAPISNMSAYKPENQINDKTASLGDDLEIIQDEEAKLGNVQFETPYGRYSVVGVGDKQEKEHAMTVFVTLEKNGRPVSSHLLYYINDKGVEKLTFVYKYETLEDAFKITDEVYHEGLRGLMAQLKGTAVEETTVAGASVDGGSSGPYVTPKMWAKDDKNWAMNKDNKTAWKGGKIVDKKSKANMTMESDNMTKTAYPDGEMVDFDDCVKYNNNDAAQKGGCSQGAVDGVVKTSKTKGSVISDEALYYEIAEQTGRSIDEVKTIIKEDRDWYKVSNLIKDTQKKLGAIPKKSEVVALFNELQVSGFDRTVLARAWAWFTDVRYNPTGETRVLDEAMPIGPDGEDD